MTVLLTDTCKRLLLKLQLQMITKATRFFFLDQLGVIQEGE